MIKSEKKDIDITYQRFIEAVSATSTVPANAILNEMSSNLDAGINTRVLGETGEQLLYYHRADDMDGTVKYINEVHRDPKKLAKIVR